MIYSMLFKFNIIHFIISAREKNVLIIIQNIQLKLGSSISEYFI